MKSWTFIVRQPPHQCYCRRFSDLSSFSQQVLASIISLVVSTVFAFIRTNDTLWFSKSPKLMYTMMSGIMSADPQAEHGSNTFLSYSFSYQPHLPLLILALELKSRQGPITIWTHIYVPSFPGSQKPQKMYARRMKDLWGVFGIGRYGNLKTILYLTVCVMT